MWLTFSFSNTIIADEVFWACYLAPRNWPPRSCDLKALDFFGISWRGNVANNPQAIPQTDILQGIHEIQPQLCQI